MRFASMREVLVLNVILLVLSLFSLATGAWILAGTRFQGGVDDLFTLFVALLLALIFAINPLLSLKNGALREWLQRRTAKAPKAEKTPAAK